MLLYKPTNFRDRFDATLPKLMLGLTDLALIELNTQEDPTPKLLFTNMDNLESEELIVDEVIQKQRDYFEAKMKMPDCILGWINADDIYFAVEKLGHHPKQTGLVHKYIKARLSGEISIEPGALTRPANFKDLMQNIHRNRKPNAS